MLELKYRIYRERYESEEMRNNDPRPPSKDDTDSNFFFDKKGAKNDSEWLIDDSQ